MNYCPNCGVKVSSMETLSDVATTHERLKCGSCGEMWEETQNAEGEILNISPITSGILCPSCECCLTTIDATHSYDIELVGRDEWKKDEGAVLYICGRCKSPLSTLGIEDVLKQVDEL